MLQQLAPVYAQSVLQHDAVPRLFFGHGDIRIGRGGHPLQDNRAPRGGRPDFQSASNLRRTRLLAWRSNHRQLIRSITGDVWLDLELSDDHERSLLAATSQEKGFAHDQSLTTREALKVLLIVRRDRQSEA